MLVMFATGIADLAWMLALTAVMVVEKVTPWGARIGPWVGAALLAAALLLAVGGAVSGSAAPEGHQMPAHEISTHQVSMS